MDILKRIAALWRRQPQQQSAAAPEPAAATVVRFCRDCRHYTAHRVMCGNARTVRVSRVTGKREADVDCNRLRADAERCGPAAAWFEPKG